MENIIPAPPSSGLHSPPSQPTPRSGAASETAGAALSGLAAFASVTVLAAWGLGTAGAFEGTSAVLIGAQVAGGVIVALGFAAQLVDSIYRR